MANFETGPEFPQIVIDMGDEERIVLNYFTTRIRTFRDPQYNHVEYRKNADAPLCGIRVTKELMDLMFENEFPYQFDPIVDPVTESWFVQAEAAHLDEEWENFEQ